MPETTSRSTSPLQDVWRAVVRHKGKAVACFLAVTASVTLVVLLMPRTYQSEGKLLVRLGRENATLDPTVTLSQEAVVAVPISRESEINSVVEILQSRSLLEKVVDESGPETCSMPPSSRKEQPAHLAGSPAAAGRLLPRWGHCGVCPGSGLMGKRWTTTSGRFCAYDQKYPRYGGKKIERRAGVVRGPFAGIGPGRGGAVVGSLFGRAYAAESSPRARTSSFLNKRRGCMRIC